MLCSFCGKDVSKDVFHVLVPAVFDGRDLFPDLDEDFDVFCGRCAITAIKLMKGVEKK